MSTEQLTPEQKLLETPLELAKLEPAQTRTLANTYLSQGMEQYGKLVVGEEDAKLLYLASLLIGAEDASMTIVFGKPSAGKSRTIGGFERIIDGYTKNEIGKVPHREDLTGAELVGKTSVMDKTIKRGDQDEETESFMSKVKAIINPSTKIIKFDEISRTSPIALNAALELLQDGFITVTNGNGEEEVSGFDSIVAGMNHYGTLYTHSADPALVSRIAYGVEMGLTTKGQISPGAQAIWRTPGRPYSTRAAIEPVITRGNLEVLRAAVDNVDISEEMTELGEKSTVVIRDSLDDLGVEMGDPRLASQQKRMAQALSLLRKRESGVGREDLLHAAEFMLIAKLGVAGTKLAAVGDKSKIRSKVDNILDTISAT